MNLKNKWILGEWIKKQKPKLLLKFPSLRTIRNIITINQEARAEVSTEDFTKARTFYLKFNLYLEHGCVCAQMWDCTL